MKYFRNDEINNERIKCLEYIFTINGLDEYIDKVIDYKGNLNIFWNTLPSDNQIELSKQVWEILGECELSHYIKEYTEIKTK